MATVTLTPKDPAKGEPIEITSDKVNNDETITPDEQTAITEEAKKKNADFNYSDYTAVIKPDPKPADKKSPEKKSSGRGLGVTALFGYGSIYDHEGIISGLCIDIPGWEFCGKYSRPSETFGTDGEFDSGWNAFGVEINKKKGWNVSRNVEVNVLGGTGVDLALGKPDKELSDEEIMQIEDSGGQVPDDLRTGTRGVYIGGAAFNRNGVIIGAHVGAEVVYDTPFNLFGKQVAVGGRGQIGTSAVIFDGNTSGDDMIGDGGRVEGALLFTVGLRGSASKGNGSDHDKDGIQDSLDRCDFTPSGEKVDKKGDYKGCSATDKNELAAKAVTTQTDEDTGVSTHTVTTSEIPPDAGEDPKVREADITAKAGDTIVVEGPDGKGWPKGTKVKFNDDDPITETNEEAGVSLNPDEPVKITVPEGVTGENTIEIQNEKGETVVRIKLTVEEPPVPIQDIEDAKIDRVVVSSKDPNPEVRVTMTSPVAGKLEAEFRKKGDANATPIPADVEPGEIKEEQVGQPVELKVTAKEKLEPGEYDLIINVLDADGKVVATGKAETETGDPFKAVNKDELTATVKMSSANDDVTTADLIEVKSQEIVDFRIEMSKPTAKVTMRILSLDQYGEVSAEVGRDDQIGTIKGRKIDGKYIVERKDINLPELEADGKGTQYRIVLEIEDTDGMKVTPEINILVLGTVFNSEPKMEQATYNSRNAEVPYLILDLNSDVKGVKIKVNNHVMDIGDKPKGVHKIQLKNPGLKMNSNVKGVKAGTYTVEVTIGDEIKTVQLVIERPAGGGGGGGKCYKPGERHDAKTPPCKK